MCELASENKKYIYRETRENEHQRPSQHLVCTGDTNKLTWSIGHPWGMYGGSLNYYLIGTRSYVFYKFAFWLQYAALLHLMC